MGGGGGATAALMVGGTAAVVLFPTDREKGGRSPGLLPVSGFKVPFMHIARSWIQ